MRKIGVVIVAAIMAFGVFSSPALASAGDPGPVKAIAQSNTPFETLDRMSDAEKAEVKEWLATASESEVSRTFNRGDDGLNVVAQKGKPYTDIAMGLVEKAACVIDVGITACNRAAKDANAASAEAAKRYPKSLHNGRGDAFRHCYWNARMVHSIGRAGAVKVSTNHESVGRGPAKEVKMDKANNKTGWAVGKATSNNTKAATSCASKANAGKLVTL